MSAGEKDDNVDLEDAINDEWGNWIEDENMGILNTSNNSFEDEKKDPIIEHAKNDKFTKLADGSRRASQIQKLLDDLRNTNPHQEEKSHLCCQGAISSETSGTSSHLSGTSKPSKQSNIHTLRDSKNSSTKQQNSVADSVMLYKFLETLQTSSSLKPFSKSNPFDDDSNDDTESPSWKSTDGHSLLETKKQETLELPESKTNGMNRKEEEECRKRNVKARNALKDAEDNLRLAERNYDTYLLMSNKTNVDKKELQADPQFLSLERRIIVCKEALENAKMIISNIKNSDHERFKAHSLKSQTQQT
jgi:hypothetical protein